MFQSLANKLITGVLSLSMLLLSSYQGNEAEFSELYFSFFGDGVLLRTKLVNAFENDFEEVFKCGKTIDIFFKIELKQGKQVLHSHEFKHSVIFDPLSQTFTVNLEEQAMETEIASYQELLDQIAYVNYRYFGDLPDEIEVSMLSYLDKIRLDSMNKEYDLMMLWKFKKAALNQIISVEQDEI